MLVDPTSSATKNQASDELAIEFPCAHRGEQVSFREALLVDCCTPSVRRVYACLQHLPAFDRCVIIPYRDGEHPEAICQFCQKREVPNG
jgi:hypothetical protein